MGEPTRPQKHTAAFVEHEVEVTFLVTATEDDIYPALIRSGICVGSLVGEALIENVQVYSPEREAESDE